MNPRRRCKGNFAAKYLVNDALKAKCGATIHLEVVDLRTSEPVPVEELADMQLEVCYWHAPFRRPQNDCKCFRWLGLQPLTSERRHCFFKGPSSVRVWLTGRCQLLSQSLKLFCIIILGMPVSSGRSPTDGPGLVAAQPRGSTPEILLRVNGKHL